MTQRSHPNFVFTHGEDICVTRFYQRDIACLSRPGVVIPLGLEMPHDGVVVGDYAWFTSVDGRLALVDLVSARVERTIDLNLIEPSDDALGWCRGFRPLEGGRAAVGFSRLRPSTMRENLRWVKHRLGRREESGVRPTRVAIYDVEREVLEVEHHLEGTGLSALFSIHEVGRDDIQ